MLRRPPDKKITSHRPFVLGVLLVILARPVPRKRRRKKQAEAVLANLHAQLSDTASSRQCFPSQGNTCARRFAHPDTSTIRKPWNSSRPPPQPRAPTGRAVLLLDGQENTRDQDTAMGSSNIAAAGEGRYACKSCGYTDSGSAITTFPRVGVCVEVEGDADDASSERLGSDRGKVSGLLVPARPETCRGTEVGEKSNVPRATRNVGPGNAAKGETAMSSECKKRRRNTVSTSSRAGSCDGDSRSISVAKTDGEKTHKDLGGATGAQGKNGQEGGEVEDIPEILAHNSSELTSSDVWGMLNSYVHRRSEVAKANRHVRAIEAMRKVTANTRMRSCIILSNAKEAGVLCISQVLLKGPIHVVS